MKKFFAVFTLLSMLVMVSPAELYGQTTSQPKTPTTTVTKDKKKQRTKTKTGKDKHQTKEKPSREQLAERQATLIAQQLGLDEPTRAKFISTFLANQKELWAARGDKNAKKNTSLMSDSEISKIITGDFEQQQRVLDIRKKYYSTYCKLLSQRQILRMYELEKQTAKRLRKHQTTVRRK